MKVLVTGAKGFIGQNMIKYLYKNTDWKVEPFDLGDDPSKALDKDWVIHLGANSSTAERNVDLMLTQNYDYTARLLDLCKNNGINIQYSSSAGIYGMNAVFREDVPASPGTPYAWSKYLVERHHVNHQGSNIVQGFRYFNVYGDHEDHKIGQASPITEFRNQLKTNGRIILFAGSHNFKRDFICVTDVCRVHVEFIQSVKSSGIFNLGTGKTYSFQQVADLISDKQEYKPFPEHMKNVYQQYTCSDNTLLEKMIGPQKWITVEEFLSAGKST